MTITYTGEVPNGSTFGCFWKILIKWRGSVYKLVWRELVAYLILYYSINLIYRFALNDEQQRSFERIRSYFNQQSETIPMSFVMGFYVSLVVKRWWEQYKLLPWPDTLALFLNAGIPGADERQRLMRRNIVRYAVLSYVITLQRVSLRVKKRFPTWQHVVDSGLMLESERKIFELMDGKTPMSKYWMPLVWATNIINRARKESLITSDHIVQTLLTELSDIRRRLGALIGYDTVCVPLVYTQVVTLALYTYFITALLGRQFVNDENGYQGKLETPDMYFPFFTALQFCFYVGWLKVAEVLINPFGEDDDDIELNWLIDRHIKASYMIVDEMHEEHPELLKDQFWDEVVPKELPYTVASENCRREEPKGSAETYKVKPQDAVYANLLPVRKHTISEDMYADYESVDTPIQRRKSSNWFSRQISRTRMGSVRSASTAYSSGGLFGRRRGNSVYASPEVSGATSGAGQLQLQMPQQQPQPKMSIYERWVGRKSSGRNQKLPKNVKSRPRIPTPDVTKEVLSLSNHHSIPPHPHYPTTYHTHHSSIPSTTQQLSPLTLIGSGHGSGEMGPLVQVVLSPIQELDSVSGSVNNTLHSGQPGTAALAQAILSPGLGPVLTPVSLPLAVSQLAALNRANGLAGSPTFIHTFRPTGNLPQPPTTPSPKHNNNPRDTTITLTELQTASETEDELIVGGGGSNQQENSLGGTSNKDILLEDDDHASGSSHASNASNTSKLTNKTNKSGTTASINSKRSLPIPPEESVAIINESFGPASNSSGNEPMSNGGVTSLTDDRSRKTSVTSQGQTGTGKRGEVYV